MGTLSGGHCLWLLWNTAALRSPPCGRVRGTVALLGEGSTEESHLLSAKALKLPAQVWLPNFSPLLERILLHENFFFFFELVTIIIFEPVVMALKIDCFIIRKKN